MLESIVMLGMMFDLGGIPMADNKQYITQLQENGSVMISEEVIETIVAQAISEVEGVVSLSSKPGAELADIVAKKSWGKGIKVTIAPDESVSVECNVVLAYGQSVVNVAKAAQVSIMNALESMTGVRVCAVNVNVCGIARK